MLKNPEEYKVITLMVGMTDVEVKVLYPYLDHLASLDRSDHVFGHTSFEKYGFHVIGASLYFGTQVLSSQDDVSNYTCPVHAKCLGLVKWVHDLMTNFDNKGRGTTIKVSNRIRSENAGERQSK
jgi:hypothetical protein